MPSPGDPLPSGHRLVRRMATAGGWLVVHPDAPHDPWIVLEPRDPLPNRAPGEEPDTHVRWVDDRMAPAWRLQGAILLSECVGPLPPQRFVALEADLRMHTGSISPEHLLWRPGSFRALPGASTYAGIDEEETEDLLGWLRPNPVLSVAGACHAGKNRLCNEDHLGWSGGLVVVADGTGGWHEGRKWARAPLLALREAFTSPLAGGEEAEAALRSGYEAALRVASGDGGASVVAVWTGPGEARILHIGDTLAWRWRGGVLTRLLTPHTLVQRLVSDGRITAAEALNHPHRNILLRCMMRVTPTEEAAPDFHRVPLESGDRLLLATDGLYDPLGEARLAELLSRGSPAQTAHALLLAAAAEETRDNLAFAVIDA